ncbi:MAG: hypothetical protein WC748_10455 [Legionellales bacterium]|jgi:hypothetical protein
MGKAQEILLKELNALMKCSWQSSSGELIYSTGYPLEMAKELQYAKFRIISAILQLSYLTSGNNSQLNSLRSLTDSFNQKYPEACKIKCENRNSSFYKEEQLTVFFEQIHSKSDRLLKYLKIFELTYRKQYSGEDLRSKTVLSNIEQLLTVDVVQELFESAKDLPAYVVYFGLINNTDLNKKCHFKDIDFDKLSDAEKALAAIMFDNTTLLDELLSSSTDQSSLTLINDHALMGFAAANGRINSMKILLKHGATLEQKYSIKLTNNRSLLTNYSYIGDGRAFFEALSNKYLDSTLEFTTLGLAVATAKYLPPAMAKDTIKFLLDSKANYNAKITRVWSEEHGYYNNRTTTSKAENISLFTFDESGYLSEAVTALKNQQVSASTKYKGNKTTPQYHNNNNNTTVTVQGQLSALQDENKELRKMIEDLYRRVKQLELNNNTRPTMKK